MSYSTLPEPAASADCARLRGDLLTLSRRLPHDLGSPLGCIAAAAGAWSELPPDLVADSLSGAVEKIEALGARLAFILRATADPLPASPVRMEEIVWNALLRLETHREKTDAAFTSPPDWPACSGVPAWIETIWENLLANSLRHAGPSPRASLGWTRTEDGVRYWVRDSGPGVPPARRGLLFYPFERLHALDAPRGYGLPIVRRLVELQGGRCGYDPEPAPGGEFFFTLPGMAQTD